MSPTDKKTILVVEDDPKTAALVALYLEREGFRTQVARDGSEALSLADRHHPVLVILDLMLPRIDGWEVFRRLRRSSEVPVIMLTARGEEVDRVAGLTLGADDYVVKPFSPRELVARVQAVLRRTAHPHQIEAEHLYAHEDLVLDTDKRRLTLAGETVPITPHEYALLRALMERPGRVFTRDELLDRLYPMGEAVVIDRVVDVHIGKLRQKIEPDLSKPRRIITVRGLGYRFADPVQSSNQG
jgi:DNA-binding response OmpR family regulator